jgi:hypothetical protein
MRPIPTPLTALCRRRWRQRSEGGNALVEFAFVVPLLLILALGTVDVGRAFSTWITVKNAAREAAEYGRLHPLERSPDGVGCSDPDNIEYRARREAGSDGLLVEVSPPQLAPCGIYPGAPAASVRPGQRLTVTVSKSFTPLTPVLDQLGGNARIRSSVTVVIAG